MLRKIKQSKIGFAISEKKRALLTCISPELVTKDMFKKMHGKKLDLSHPVDLNEKLQFLKLRTYYNNPVITQCADKYAVREYLVENKWEKILPELIAGPLYNANDIYELWDEFPSAFVIKCNHGCGYNILVANKQRVDLNDVVEKLSHWMKEDYWKVYCEPQYKYIKKSIIVEEYLGDNIETYKFYCFNGKPEVMYLSSNGPNGEKDLYLDYYDMNMNWLDITLKPHQHAKVKKVKPTNWDELVKTAEALAKPFPFVRIDLYDVNGKIYISEFTFIPTGGNMQLEPECYITDWGNLLKL